MTMSRCRACLKSEREMIPFDEKHVMYFNILTNLNLELALNDPQQLCKHCSSTLEQFIDFRTKCIAANVLLSSIISTEIKQEREHGLDDGINFDIKKELPEVDHNVEIEYMYDNDNLTYELVAKTEDLNRGDIHGLKRKNGCVKENADIVSDKKRKCNIRKHTANKKNVKTTRKKKENKNINSFEKKFKPKTIKEPSDNSLPCGLCTKSFNNNEELQSHILIHRQYNSCSICKEKFLDWQELMSHRMVHLPAKNLQCHLCPQKYKSSLHLEYHFRLHHSSEGDRKTLRCRTCSRNYRTPRRVRRHWNYTHNATVKEFYCDYCKKLCTNKSNLRSHIISHLDIKPYTCDLCNSKFKSSQQLLSHKMYKHTPDREYCTWCKRVFVSKSEMDKHVCKQSDGVCPVCGKIFKNKSAVDRHIRMHDENRGYKCDRCPATYKTRTNLAVHKDKHDGIRKYACEFCPAKFYFPTVLIKHRRIHTGIKPYVCEICQKAFTGNHNLKVHMRVHGKFLINKKQPDLMLLETETEELQNNLISIKKNM